ncbi:MAG: GNAT family N-acetyltransferase [Thermoguttaceae bacterium]|nr:GNAT family N-acetyltransferase [Thermoguttaceae bacterium]
MTDIPVKVAEARSFRQRRAFLNFPFKLYKDDPYWVPNIRMDEKGLVGFSKNPFYERNSCQAFLAYRGKEVVGRIVAILNVGHLERYHDGVGFFGFFESIDDQAVADALFDAAAAWLKERGCTTVRGPMNPSMNHTVGLLIEGFDSSPFFMMTYNPPYYARLIENYGFAKVQDLFSFWGEIDMLPKVRERYLDVCNHIAERTGAKVRSVDIRHFGRDVEAFLGIYNRSLTNTWGFVPFSDSELKDMAFGLKFLIVPDLVFAVELDGKIVGAAFCLPDYNPRIRAIKGKLFPFGFLKLLRRKQEIKRIRVLSTNVLPEYQMLGLGLVLVNALVPRVMDWGIQEAEFSWVLESNEYSRGSLERGGAIVNKKFRVYDKPIG